MRVDNGAAIFTEIFVQTEVYRAFARQAAIAFQYFSLLADDQDVLGIQLPLAHLSGERRRHAIDIVHTQADIAATGIGQMATKEYPPDMRNQGASGLYFIGQDLVALQHSQILTFFDIMPL